MGVASSSAVAMTTVPLGRGFSSSRIREGDWFGNTLMMVMVAGMLGVRIWGLGDEEDEDDDDDDDEDDVEDDERDSRIMLMMYG